MTRIRGTPHPAALLQPHHPAEPQAGLTGRAQGYVGWGHIRGRLEGLDLSRRLAGWARAHDVHLAHAEAGGGGKQEGEGGPRPEARPSSGSASPAAPLPVVGEGVQVRYFHRAGVRLVGELVNQQPLLSLPDDTHLETGDALRPVLPATDGA